MSVDFGTLDALEEISKQVKQRRCVLFLGSAVHAPVTDGMSFTYAEEHRPAMAGELEERLTRRCRKDSHYDPRRDHGLQRMALYYELGRSRHQLIEEIHEAVQLHKRPSPVVHALARMDFPVVLTTNYDNLYEQALRAAGKDPLVFVYRGGESPNVTREQLLSEQPIIFKLHGDIASPDTIVITEDDYIDFVGHMTAKREENPIPNNLMSILMTWTTVFLGYSMADYNLRILFRLLHLRTDEASFPLMYSIDRNPDVLTREVWGSRRRYLRFVVEDVWRFVPDLYREVLGEELQP